MHCNVECWWQTPFIRWGLPHLRHSPGDQLRVRRLHRGATLIQSHYGIICLIIIGRFSYWHTCSLADSPGLLCWPRGWVPGVPHLRQLWWRQPGQVQLPLPQRDPLQPAVLHLRLVVQRGLLTGRRSLRVERGGGSSRGSSNSGSGRSEQLWKRKRVFLKRFDTFDIWLRYLMEVLPGDANGAGSETLSTYTALGADVRTPWKLFWHRWN